MFRRAYFSIAIFAIAVLALLTSPQNSITVISTSQETRFPEEVVFTLEAQSNADIVEITFFYNVASAKVSSYRYPEFAPGRHVIAKTVIKTNGDSYIPPGVDFRYHYLIIDAEGNEFETSPQLYKYRDPRFEWHELTDGFLTVLWHDYSEEAVRERVSEVKARLATVARVFGLKGDLPQVRAILYRSSSSATQVFPLVSETASRQHIFGGFAFAEYGMFLLVGLDVNGMVHESTHIMLDEAITSSLVRMPAWLNEGLATYFESEAPVLDSILAQAAASDYLLRLSHMNSVPGRPRDVRLFYAQARSFISYLMGTYGEDNMTLLIKSLNNINGLDKALKDVYGLSMEDLETNWKAHLAGESPPVVPRDFSSFTLVGALLLLALLSILTWAYRKARARGGTQRFR